MAQYIGRFLSAVKNLRTGAILNCLDEYGDAVQVMDSSVSWRTPVAESVDTSGGVMSTNRSLMDTRTLKVTYRKKYGPLNPTYTSVWNEAFAVLGLGDDLRLSVIEADGTTRYFYGRCDDIGFSSKTENYAIAEVPLTFTLPDPLWTSVAKPGVKLCDTGLVANSGLHADDDPDNFTVGSGFTAHTILNPDAVVADTGPIVYMQGPMTGFCIVWNLTLPKINGTPWFVYYGRGVAAGEIIKIDSGSGDVTSNLSSTDAYGGFTYGPGQQYWFMIERGSNSIQVGNGGAGTGARVRIDYLSRGG